jgi:carbamoyl-phosphate synthase small subunit
MDLTTRKVEVTAHNHGFAVAAAPRERHETPYGLAEVSHICLNDDVVEGLQLTAADGRLLAFSVQYHPEAAAGPHDASYLFDRFVDLMALRQTQGTSTRHEPSEMRPEPSEMRPEPVEGRES